MMETSKEAELSGAPRHPRNDPAAPPNWVRLVPMFTCQKMHLFSTEILEKNDTIDDDCAVFTKLRSEYWKSLGISGPWSITTVLQGIRCVKVGLALFPDIENVRLLRTNTRMSSK